MLAYLLIIIYVSLALWWISKSPFFAIPQLSRPMIGGIFIIKILAGISYGLVHQAYFYDGDTFLYFEESRRIANSFWQYPSYYFSNWLGYATAAPEGADVFLYPSSELFWKNLGTYVLVHVHAIPAYLSFGSYNVHIVFVALISLVASVQIFKVFQQQLNITPTLLIIACFFMPSVLYWTSGFHKDVWIYLGMSYVLLAIHHFNEGNPRKTVRNLLLGLLIVGLFRSYLLALLLPALVCFSWASYATKLKSIYKYGIVYGSLLLTLLGIELLSPYSILEILSDKHAAFLEEGGGSMIEGSQNWSATWIGFFSFLPLAALNVSFRPLLWECQDFLQVMASLEILIFWMLVVLNIRTKKQAKSNATFVHFIVFYCISNLLLIGLLVSNVGTIVRYRSIALGLLAIVIVQAIPYLRKSLKDKQLKRTAQQTSPSTPSQSTQHVESIS